VAVLAAGIDDVYPPQNEELHRAIAGRGLLLAETPFGTPPIARSFPRRNRIVSGLSAGVILIEAAERSGSLITAERALEPGREVFVMAGSPMDPRDAGSNNPIRQRAILVRDANDIISVFGKPQSPPQVVEKPEEPLKDSTTATVLQALGAVPTAVDELVRRCQVSAATVAEGPLGPRAGRPPGKAPG
jgi:DNA processing protein